MISRRWFMCLFTCSEVSLDIYSICASRISIRLSCLWRYCKALCKMASCTSTSQRRHLTSISISLVGKTKKCGLMSLPNKRLLINVSTYQVYLGGKVTCGVAAVHLSCFVFLSMKDFSVSGVSMTFRPGAFRKPSVIWLGISFVFHMTRMPLIHTYIQSVDAFYNIDFYNTLCSY